MEVFFLDVAQGTCQIILLGERRAIVLDCGLSRDRMALQFLTRQGIEYLDALIVSHSHNDHIGGAVSVLGEYLGRIGKICFVQDHLFLKSRFWARISESLNSGALNSDQLIRLEATNGRQLVWSDGNLSAQLLTTSPAAAQNLRAQAARQPNPTSAVLFLESRDRRVIFASDSEVGQWREIRQRSGRRLECHVLAVPHHAGQVCSTPGELGWLFGEALHAEVAVISVGTSNPHGHPRQDVISALTASGAKVLCTQITHRCYGNLEELRPAVLRPIRHLGKSSPTRQLTGAGKSKDVGCAGTVRVTLSASGIEVERLAEHQQAVDKLIAGSSIPLCRC